MTHSGNPNSIQVNSTGISNSVELNWIAFPDVQQSYWTRNRSSTTINQPWYRQTAFYAVIHDGTVN